MVYHALALFCSVLLDATFLALFCMTCGNIAQSMQRAYIRCNKNWHWPDTFFFKMFREKYQFQEQNAMFTLLEQKTTLEFFRASPHFNFRTVLKIRSGGPIANDNGQRAFCPRTLAVDVCSSRVFPQEKQDEEAGFRGADFRSPCPLCSNLNGAGKLLMSDNRG